MKRRPGTLRIICTGEGQGGIAHTVRELAQISWTAPDDSAAPAALAPLRDLALSVSGESWVRGRGGQWRTYRRVGVEMTTRADGGTTLSIPACPTCSQPGEERVMLRDDTLRNYVEKARDTPLEGTLNVTHLHSM